MELSAHGLVFIAGFERYREKEYLCTDKKRTIGFGHRLYGKESYPNGVTVVKAMKLLVTDVQIKEERLHPFIKVDLNQRQYDALVSLAFNVGVGSLKVSRLIKAINRRDWITAAGQGGVVDVDSVVEMIESETHHPFIGEWDWARNKKGGPVSRGLTRRRMVEAAMFRGRP